MIQTNSECFRDDVEALFAEKDRDNDGLLSFEEFTGQETKVEKAFKAIDKVRFQDGGIL